MSEGDPKIITLGTEESRDREFTIDNVTLVRDSLGEIRVKCWGCEKIFELGLIQKHLIAAHRGSQCPGKRCGGFLIVPSMNLLMSMHLKVHHFDTTCPQGHIVNLLKYDHHIVENCKVEKIQDVRSNSIVFPCDEVPIKKVTGEKGTYYFDGELVVVDGINYCIRKDDLSIFVDCPFCEKACGLNIIGSHIIEDHSKDEVMPCIAPECPKKCIKPINLKYHILENHATLRCKECKWLLTIVEVQNHLNNYCPNRLKDTGPVLPRKYPTLACPYCSMEVLHLNDHIKKRHLHRIKCFICNKYFRKSQLMNHMAKHHKDNKELYYKRCSICNADVIKLDNHMEAMHGQGRESKKMEDKTLLSLETKENKEESTMSDNSS
ncbi:uncharacterized protein [Lepeophtheirus salmonis]|uniref:uncharacterized protein n=1 Tax=Lepeophtheirus salmonis TaxID=72036 RepID=UPI001AE204FF|nr:uncharacterized protein LOC121113751 [Lepeophtheirus salmonis]